MFVVETYLPLMLRTCVPDLIKIGLKLKHGLNWILK